MCGHKQIGIWEMSKITAVDSNDVVNHWLMTGAINIPTFLSDKTLCNVTPEVEAVVINQRFTTTLLSTTVIFDMPTYS